MDVLIETMDCGVSFYHANIIDNIPRVAALTQRHANEVTVAGGIPQEADIAPEAYEALVKHDLVYAISACHGEDVVGYSVNILNKSWTRGFKLEVLNHTIFVDKPWRAKGVGKRLMELTCDTARERGAQYMKFHGIVGTPMMKLLPRAGYTPEYTVFTKEL